MQLLSIKACIFGIFAAVGGFFSLWFGGWAVVMMIFVALMIVDYVTGFTLAAVFKKSQKTLTGGLSSKIGIAGVFKKVFMFGACWIAAQLDNMFNTHLFLAAIASPFLVNEIVSIMENLGLMGVKIPVAISNALDVLKTQSKNASQQALESIENVVCDVIVKAGENLSSESQTENSTETDITTEGKSE